MPRVAHGPCDELIEWTLRAAPRFVQCARRSYRWSCQRTQTQRHAPTHTGHRHRRGCCRWVAV